MSAVIYVSVHYTFLCVLELLTDGQMQMTLIRWMSRLFPVTESLISNVCTLKIALNVLFQYNDLFVSIKVQRCVK